MKGSARLGLLSLVLLVGCDKARSSAPPAPDFAGTWDVTFDDALALELRVGEQTLRAELPESGGHVALEASKPIALNVDCAAEGLVCPFEVLARELTLHGPPGQLDADAVQLARSLEGTGSGACTARAGSFLTGEVLSSPRAQGQTLEAVALTAGQATVIVSADCVAPKANLPKGTEVVLSTGFTAAKR